MPPNRHCHLTKFVLVRVPNWLGDLCMATPALRLLRQGLPEDTKLVIVARSALAELCSQLGLADEVWPVDRAGRLLSGEIGGLVGGVVPVAGILLTNSFRPAWQLFRSGAPIRVGSDLRWYVRPLQTHSCPSPVVASMGEKQAVAPPAGWGGPRTVEGYLQIAQLALKALGLSSPVDPSSDTSLRIPTPVRTKADEWLHHLTGGANGLDASLLIGFQAGAAYGAAKRWPAERLGAAIRQLLVRHPHALAIGLGSDAERSELLAVQHQADPDGTFARRIFVGDSNLPLAEFAALIASLTLVLANDSGPMHLAVALGIPCVAVFGPTDWIATGYADGPRYRLIREPGVECSPCQRRECPIDHRCMTRIPVERAVLAAEELLAWARPATNAVENG